MIANLLRVCPACVLLLALAGCTPPDESPPVADRATILATLGEVDPWRRTIALAELLSRQPPEAVATVRDLLEDPPHELGVVPTTLLARFWAEHEPAAAARWSLERSPLPYRFGLIDVTVAAWARRDPGEAVRKLGAGGAYAGAREVMVPLVRGWYESGEPGLADYVRDLGPSPNRQRALAHLLRFKIRREGPQAAGRWAEEAAREADATYRRTLLRHAGSELAIADPASGVAWCERHCDGAAGSGVRQMVAQRWAAQDARAALDWLEASDAADPTERQRALRAAYAIAVQTDRATALAWVEAFDAQAREEAWRQPAILIYANAVSDERPEEALRWTALLQDAAQRERARIALAQRWYRKDAEAAEAWLAKSDLSEAVWEQVRAAPVAARGRSGPWRRNALSREASPSMMEPSGTSPPAEAP